MAILRLPTRVVSHLALATLLATGLLGSRTLAAECPPSCEDTNPCTADSCDTTTGLCRHTPTPGVSCFTGNLCILNQSCNAQGECVGTPRNCDDGNPCTDNECGQGHCRNFPYPTGTQCDDQNVCTPPSASTCQQGVCNTPPAWIYCLDSSECTSDGCNPTTGCFHTAVPDGSGCPPPDECSSSGVCSAGVCAPGTPFLCDDGVPCSIDSCAPGQGCLHSAPGSDLDADGTCDALDNCPSVANPGQQNADGDANGDACDCRPTDASAYAVPPEITSLGWLDKNTLRWTVPQPSGGSGTTYDILTGLYADLPLGGGTGACLAAHQTATPYFDGAHPSSQVLWWYLVRAHNACGAGTYGYASVSERVSSGCP